jgi:signal transduction histidine kinase
VSSPNDRILMISGGLLLALAIGAVVFSWNQIMHPWWLLGCLVILGVLEALLAWAGRRLQRESIGRTTRVLLLVFVVLLATRLVDFLHTPMWVLVAIPAVAMALLWSSTYAAIGISVFFLAVIGSVIFVGTPDSAPPGWKGALDLAITLGYLWVSALLLIPLLDAVQRHHETRKVELALSASRHLRLEAILSAISTSVFVVDRSGWIRRANRAAEDLTGRSAERLEGILVDAVVHLGWDAEGGEVAEPSGRSEIPVRGGEPIPVAYRVVPLLPTEDYLVLLHDLRSQYAALESLELRAEELDELRDTNSQFVATVTHQMRTPLDALLNEANLLTDVGAAPGDSRQRRYTGIIKRNAEQLLELVDDMLLISRLDADLATPDLDEMTVHRLLREAGIPRTASLDAIAAGGAIPMVRVDRQWIDRIFLEILDPIPFVGGAPVQVEHNVHAGRYRLRIPSRRLEPDIDETFVFQPHFPEHEGPSPFSNTRLGLYLVRRMAQGMDGSLQAQPGDNSDGVFVLDLPISGYREA